MISAYGGGAMKPVPAFLKMDIEGGEYTVLPALLASRALCGRIGFVLLEWHLNKLPRSKRRGGLALTAAMRTILNVTCRAEGYEPPRLVHDVVPENNLQVDLGGGCRSYCYNKRYCSRPDCAACARCYSVPAEDVRRLVARVGSVGQFHGKARVPLV